jgi:hypothetical protein
MALVVLGLFVLVWIISAVVKASQDSGPKRPPAGRPRPVEGPRAERTSNSDIDRFMAEIDRLRRKGEGAPAGRGPTPAGPVPRPIVERPARVEPRPKPPEPRRERDRDRRQRQAARPTPAPPPLPRSEAVPVLRPVTPDAPATMASAPIKPAQTAKTTATTTVSSSTRASPIVETLQTVLRGRHGPAAALILAEIFGAPRGHQPVKPKTPPIV